MRYSFQTQDRIIAEIAEHPDRAIVLPDFAYWKGQTQPLVYIDGLPERLNRHLYRMIIGPLAPDEYLYVNDGVPERNINPHLFTVVKRTVRRGLRCPKGHLYEGNELDTPIAGRRCRTCFLLWRESNKLSDDRRNAGQRNAAKTHCVNGHPFAGDNLILMKNGNRRCRTCHNETVRKWRERNHS